MLSSGVLQPHRFSRIIEIWYCFWNLCKGLRPLYPYQAKNKQTKQSKKKKKKKNTKTNHVMAKFVLDIISFETSDFHWVCSKSFLEWIVKHKKISLGWNKQTNKHPNKQQTNTPTNKQTNKQIFLVLCGLRQPPVYHPFLNDPPVIFFPI